MLSSHLHQNGNESKLMNKESFESPTGQENSATSLKDSSSDQPRKTADKIYVGHLPSHIQKRDLEDLFGYYGPLLSVEVKHGGFAFIHFESQQDAQDAVSALHNYIFDGRRLTVEFSLKKGNSASNGCLVCGKEGHWARDCPDNKEKGLDVKSGKCFKCGQGGHLARFCRTSESRNGMDDGSRSTREDYRDRDRSFLSSSRSTYHSNSYPYPADYSPHHREYRGDYRQDRDRDYRLDRDRDYVRAPSGRGDYMVPSGSSRRPRSPLSPRRAYPASSGPVGYYDRAGNNSEGVQDSQYRYGDLYRNSGSRSDYDYRSAPGEGRYDDGRYSSRGPAVPYDYMERDSGAYSEQFYRGYSNSRDGGGRRERDRDYYPQRGHEDSKRSADREYQGSGGGEYVERR